MRASCNSIEVQVSDHHTSNGLKVHQVPWTNLKNKPITITLDKVSISLSEPTQISPVTDYLNMFRKYFAQILIRIHFAKKIECSNKDVTERVVDGCYFNHKRSRFKGANTLLGGSQLGARFAHQAARFNHSIH
jgi:hypothetical protein